MRDHFPDGTPVRNDEPVKIPVAFQYLALQEPIGRGRDAIQHIKRVHYRSRTGVDPGPERGQHYIIEGGQPEIGRIVIPSAFRKAIACKMLETGCNGQGIPQVRPLETTHAGRCNPAAQVRVLPGPFHDPPPTRVAGYIDHGGKRPVDSGGRCFPGSQGRGFPNGIQVPAGRLGKGNRADGFQAVNNVLPKQQRDPQAGFINGDLLQSPGIRGIGDIQHGADLSAAQVGVFLFCIPVLRDRAGDVPEPVVLVHLTGFFLQGHNGNKGIQECFFRGVPGRCFLGMAMRDSQNGCQ